MGVDEEKSQPATARKLRKARKKGQVAYSGELTMAGMLTGGVALIWGGGPWLWSRLTMMMRVQFWRLGERSVLQASGEAFAPIVLPMLYFLLILCLLAVGIPWFQRGWIWAWPKRGKKRGGRAFYPLLKLGVIALIGWVWLAQMTTWDLSQLFSEAMGLAFAVSLGLLLLALGDYFYQRWRFSKEMQMTPQEVKEEIREEHVARKR